MVKPASVPRAGLCTKAVFFFIYFLASMSSSWAQDPGGIYGGFCPPGSRPVGGGGGYMCVCPDGSYAGMDGCAGNQQQSICPPDTTYCPNANLCCGSGKYCSRYGCTPYGAVECGNGYCQPGQQCSKRGGCMPEGSVECGSYYCEQGQRCGKTRRVCLAHDQVDCDSYICNPGSKCGSGNKCLGADVVDCGGGRSCPSGNVCLNGGAECRTARQIAEEKRQQQQQIVAKANQQRSQDLAARQQSLAASQQDCSYKKIVAIANGGNPDLVACGGLSANSANSIATAPPAAQQQSRLEYLRRNATQLQPEQRTLSSVPVTANPPQASVTGFSQEITPTSDLGKILAEEAAAYKKRKEAEAEQLSAQQQLYEQQLREAEAKRKRAQRKSRASGDSDLEYPDVEEKEDCGWRLAEGARRAQCGLQGGGIWCTKIKRTRFCREHYVLGIKRTDCGKWTEEAAVGFCKPDKANVPDPKFCDYFKCD
jgi:hypothetical protein